MQNWKRGNLCARPVGSSGHLTISGVSTPKAGGSVPMVATYWKMRSANLWPKIKEAFINEPAMFIVGVAFGVLLLVGILMDTFNPPVEYPTAWDKL